MRRSPGVVEGVTGRILASLNGNRAPVGRNSFLMLCVSDYGSCITGWRLACVRDTSTVAAGPGIGALVMLPGLVVVARMNLTRQCRPLRC